MTKLVIAVVLALGADAALAQQWYPLSDGKSRDPKKSPSASYAQHHRCERGYWVRYTPTSPTNQKEPLTKACAPEGAVCKWYEQRLPNGARSKLPETNCDSRTIGRKRGLRSTSL
jgi:hypothetical protein